MLKRALLGLAAIVAMSTAQADTLYVTEYTAAPPDSVYYQAARTPAQANQTVAIAAASAQSAAFSIMTGLVRLHCDIACHVEVGGTNPTATTSSARLVAGQTEYFVVKPGDKVAVIADPTP